jgi:preprotein translocase subunit SecD
VHDEVLLTNADIDTALVSMRNERPAVDVFFTDGARVEFAAITRDNKGKRMGIILDGELVSAPIIRSPILQGRAIIMGDFTMEEAERIAEGIMHK